MKMNTYLNYGGNCGEAFRFYEKELGAKINMLLTHDQNPGPSRLSAELGKTVLHASITIAGTTIMASDVPPDRFQPIQGFTFRFQWTAIAKPSGFTRCSPRAARYSCPYRRRFSRRALRNYATASAHHG